MSAFRWVGALGIGLALVATACVGEELAPRAASELDAAYQLVVTAVNDGDRTEALRALRSLTETVKSGQSSGAIDPARADEILEAADGVLADLRLLPPPVVSSSPSATATPEPSPSEEPDEDHEDSDEPGEGKAKGHDKESKDEGGGNAHGED